jgi:HEAT repeat protein
MRRAGAVADLFRALQAKSTRRRLAAIDALDRLQSDRAIPGLKLALRDPDWRVRERAAEVVGRLKPPGQAPEALLLALDDADERVRRAAAAALVDTKHPQALRVLVEGMNSSDWRVRNATLDALRALDPDQRDALGLMLSFEEVEALVTGRARLGRRPPTIESL